MLFAVLLSTFLAFLLDGGQISGFFYFLFLFWAFWRPSGYLLVLWSLRVHVLRSRSPFACGSSPISRALVFVFFSLRSGLCSGCLAPLSFQVCFWCFPWLCGFFTIFAYRVVAAVAVPLSLSAFLLRVDLVPFSSGFLIFLPFRRLCRVFGALFFRLFVVSSPTVGGLACSVSFFSPSCFPFFSTLRCHPFSFFLAGVAQAGRVGSCGRRFLAARSSFFVPLPALLGLLQSCLRFCLVFPFSHFSVHFSRGAYCSL